MIILIMLTVLSIVGVIGMCYFDDDLQLDLRLASSTVGLVASSILIIMLIIIPFNRYEIRKDIVGYNALKETIETSRNSNMSEIERAALTQKIADNNIWLKELQYGNQNIWNIYIPDEVMELELLK